MAAKFVRLDGERVVLESREGREFQIRREALSEGDRALPAMEREWPGVRAWPMALAGHSGGAKFTSYLAAALCANGWSNVVGMRLGGCNRRFVEKGAATHRPNRHDLIRIPVYLSSGRDDTVGTPRHMSNVRDALDRQGFKKVRLETAPGGHEVRKGHPVEGLEWFLELAGAPARPGAGGPLPLRPSRIHAH